MSFRKEIKFCLDKTKIKEFMEWIQKKGAKEQRKINLEKNKKKREKRKTRRVRKKYVKQPGFSVNPKKEL